MVGEIQVVRKVDHIEIAHLEINQRKRKMKRKENTQAGVGDMMTPDQIDPGQARIHDHIRDQSRRNQEDHVQDLDLNLVRLQKGNDKNYRSKEQIETKLSG